MRRTLFSAAFALCCVMASGQSSREEYLNKYNRLTDRLGLDGVGVETHLSKWEADFPDDTEMLAASFLYYYTKSGRESTISLSSPKYMGTEPVLELKDSTGAPVYYFYDTAYDDEMFGKAVSYLDKANRLEPDRLENRLAYVSAFVNYEKESPDIAVAELDRLIDYNFTSSPSWTYGGEAADEDFFMSSVQDYCYSFYRIGKKSGYEAFRKVSEHMLTYRPDAAVFLDNVGSYYLVCMNEPKTALRYYDKALKAKPDDNAAIRNAVIIARRLGNTRMEKKYLAMMARYGEDEAARKSAAVRLDYLGKPKKK